MESGGGRTGWGRRRADTRDGSRGGSAPGMEAEEARRRGWGGGMPILGMGWWLRKSEYGQSGVGRKNREKIKLLEWAIFAISPQNYIRGLNKGSAGVVLWEYYALRL